MTPEVVCVGLATWDTVLLVPRLPEADGRVVASERVEAGGGPAATAAVAVARLGVPAAFAGRVGDDEAGARVREALGREGVDVSELEVVPGGVTPRSTILVEEPTGRRAIVHHEGTVLPLALGERAAARCRAAAWTHVDHAGWGAAPEGARISVDGGNPIPDLDLARVALYAPTESALREAFGSPQAALEAGAGLVVVTRGEGGSAAYGAGGVSVEAPPHAVEPLVSTLGAGDVFHGALLAALVQDAPLADALAFANRCAALSCRALDGRSAIPTPQEVHA